jgi:hypothetical protein
MDINEAQKDLAFLKGLVNEGPKTQRSAGELFLVGGVVYGLQCLLNATPILLKLEWSSLAYLAIGILPTVIFLGWMFWLMWRNRHDKMQGVATRAMNAAFSSAGLANLSMCVALGWVSYTENNFLIWLLYPAVVAALQGACWYVAYMIRKKLWLAGVSAGWFVTSVALGFLIRDTGSYLLVFAAAMFVLMAAPGYVMMQQSKAH